MEASVTTIDSRWNDCLRMISNNISPEQFNTWFAPITFVNFEEDERQLTLGLPSPFIKEYIEAHFLKLFRAVLQRVYGPAIRLKYEVKVDATNNIRVAEQATDQSTQVGKPVRNTGINQSPRYTQALDSQLKADYTFDNFIEGDSNKLTRTVGLAIAQNPRQVTFNPLFIYGGSGVGKTHLVNAIGTRLKELHPQLRVLYVSAHLFQVQYTDCVRQNTVNDFIAFYQSIDVLIIDDIQEFASLQKTQLAFFHIFNHLHQNGRQLIMTSDRPPMALQGMEERLLTRFKWGLLAELEQPSESLRRDILRYRIHRDGLNISEDVIHFIASNVDHSIRDLEGVINALMAYSVVYNCDIDLALAERVIGRTVGLHRQRPAITLERILEHTCNFFEQTADDVLSSSRKASVVLARQVVMYLTQKHTTLSTTRIGMAIGRRGHATVVHSCQAITHRLETDAAFRNRIAELEAQISE